MEEKKYWDLDIRRLFAYLFRKWFIIFIAMIIGTLGAHFISEHQDVPLYRSTTLLYVGPDYTEVATIAGINLSGELAEDYTIMATSNPVIDYTVEKLSNEGFDVNRQIVQGATDVTQQSSRIIRITALTTDANKSKLIAEGMSEGAIVHIEEVTHTVLPTVVERAEVMTEPLPQPFRLHFGAGIAGLFAIAVLTIRFILDGRVKSEIDAKRHFNTNVLGVISSD